MKMLALSFLLLIGVVLIADGFGQHVSKGYIYFAMAFSLFVEILNIRIRPKGGRQGASPAELRVGEMRGDASPGRHDAVAWSAFAIFAPPPEIRRNCRFTHAAASSKSR